MKQVIFSISAIALSLASAACSKKIAAAPPPPPAPVAVAAAPTAAQPVAARPAPQRTAPAPKTIAQTPQRSNTISARDRATLNETLARLVDALFDYDKSTIRPDASTALKDDVNVI